MLTSSPRLFAFFSSYDFDIKIEKGQEDLGTRSIISTTGLWPTCSLIEEYSQ
jgi:hypothetical protein